MADDVDDDVDRLVEFWHDDGLIVSELDTHAREAILMKLDAFKLLERMLAPWRKINPKNWPSYVSDAMAYIEHIKKEDKG
jgi:hypothetical protein